jgi:hypothetical protein
MTSGLSEYSVSSPSRCTRPIVLAFGLAMSGMFIPGNSCAQGQTAPQAPAKPPEIHAILDRVVHPSRVKVGDSVTARITEPTKLRDGTEIPNGAHVIGKVTEIKKKADKEGPSKLGLLFDKAQLKDGKVIQVLMALVSVAPRSEPGSLDSLGADKMAGNGLRHAAEMEANGSSPGEVNLAVSGGVRGSTKVTETALQPGVCYLPDITIASYSMGQPGTILQSAKSTVYLDSGSRLLLQLQ